MRLLPLLALPLLATFSSAAEVRVLPPGELPRDARLAPLKDLDGYFPFTPPASPEAWAPRAEKVRRQILVSQGLWPMPEKAALNAVIHGRIERDDYTVEKVFFESFPGFFVTGNLYRPKPANGAPAPAKMPGILCPHGHWPNGRFMEVSDSAVEKEIATGGEKFRDAARSPLQARCVQLARMGCVVFHFDMIGYADSVQLSQELAHGFKKQRPEMSTPENWGFFSPQAELRAQSIMGLQTWNGIRALDFLQSLPDVDPQRIGVTGASGGGTQTMLLGAIDPRVSAAFPAVMVSTAMQGGCTCENASLLRVGTGNIEFAALFAPKPMAMSTADDWTKEMRTKGFPELKKHWTVLGAPNHVALHDRTEFPHNFNAPSRAAMAAWFNQHLKLNLSEAQLAERDFQRLTRDEMSVWDAAHPAPAVRGPEAERHVLREWHEASLEAMRKAGDLFPEVIRPAVETILGRTFAEAGEATWELKDKQDRGDYLQMTGLIRNTTHGEELPALSLHPKRWNGNTVLWLGGSGKRDLFAAEAGSEQPIPEVRSLLDSGASVLSVDLLFQGEFTADGKPLASTPRVKNPREAAAYTFGYNPALFAQRVHDILTVAKLVRTDEKHHPKRLAILADHSAGALAAAARAVSGEAIDAVAIVPTESESAFEKVSDLHDPVFLPGIAKYGGYSSLLKLGGERPLLVGRKLRHAPLDKAFAVEWLRDALR